MTISFSTQQGIPKHLIPDAAAIYYEAFEQKLGGILGRGEIGAGFIERVIDPQFSFTATAGQGKNARLLGIAGFKTTEGSLVGGAFSDLSAHYGFFGGCWRAIPLSFLERALENNVLLMDGIAVTAESRGLGVGSALLDAIVEHARNLNYSEVRLDVIDQNPRAKKLYLRKGFEEVGEENLGPLKYIFGFSSATKMKKPINTA